MASEISTDQQRVSPELARRWLHECAFEGQHKLRPSHVNFLAAEMAAGRFRPGTVIEFATFGDRDILVNGQHTLAALVQNGSPIPLTVLRRTVADTEALTKLYATYNMPTPPAASAFPY